MLGLKVLDEIPFILRPLADAAVASYQRHHSDLRSVYVIGSVAVGEWTEGVSDLDVVGVVKGEVHPESEAARRRELLKLGRSWPQVSFINNSILSLALLHLEDPDVTVLGRARIIAVTGLHVWGDTLDFRPYFPSVEVMAYGRARRAKILMGRYRNGIINEPFRSNPQLLARSSAKATLRVLSGITILRDAVFYTSPNQTAMTVAQYAPEAMQVALRALAIINGAQSTADEAMSLTEEAIELFYSLYPDPESG